MKIAVLILGLLGSIAFLTVGAIWLSDYNAHKDEIAGMKQTMTQLGASGAIDEQLKELQTHVRAAYSMLVLGGLSFLASILVFKVSKLSGAILILSVLIPAILLPKTLLFSFFLLIAGALAFAVKPKKVAQTA